LESLNLESLNLESLNLESLDTNLESPEIILSPQSIQMSNFMRSRAQIPQAIENFVTLSGCQLYTRDFTGAVLNVSTATDYDLSANGAPLAAGVMLRDMGRSLTLYVDGANERSVKVAILREVRIVNGAMTEGVSDLTPYLTPVWVDAPTADVGDLELGLNVRVARCG